MTPPVTEFLLECLQDSLAKLWTCENMRNGMAPIWGTTTSIRPVAANRPMLGVDRAISTWWHGLSKFGSPKSHHSEKSSESPWKTCPSPMAPMASRSMLFPWRAACFTCFTATCTVAAPFWKFAIRKSNHPKMKFNVWAPKAGCFFNIPKEPPTKLDSLRI